MMPEGYEFHPSATAVERQLITSVYDAENPTKLRIGQAVGGAYMRGEISTEGMRRVLKERAAYRKAYGAAQATGVSVASVETGADEPAQPKN